MEQQTNLLKLEPVILTTSLASDDRQICSIISAEGCDCGSAHGCGSGGDCECGTESGGGS